MSKSKQVPVGSLIEDPAIMVRPGDGVDSTNLSNLIEALRVGAQFPPIIADKGTRTVVDGIHRRRAYTKLYGPEHLVDVDFRSYADRAAMLLESISINASHGMPYTPSDRTRGIALLKEFGVDEIEISRVFSMEVARVESIYRQKIGYEEVTGRPVALKRPFHHLAQTTLTQEQIELNRAATGRDQLRLINDVIQIIQTPGALDAANVLISGRIDKLLEAICIQIAATRGGPALDELLASVHHQATSCVAIPA